MRLALIIILLVIILPLFSQKRSSNEIDSILNESFQKFAELQFIESSKLADQAFNLSISENYSRGKVMSNIYIAKETNCGESVRSKPFWNSLDEVSY